MIFKCEYCGKEFKAKPSLNRKYCCKDCCNKANKGKTINKPKKEKTKVICAECGKEEYVFPSRAKRYLCCSVACLSQYNSKRYSRKITQVCPICGKEYQIKQKRYKRIKTQSCCSIECASELKKITYLGERNHQFGLKGELNASFKGEKTKKKNVKLNDI